MSINWIIVITILALLGLERLVVTTTTKKPQFINVQQPTGRAGAQPSQPLTTSH